MRSEAEIRRALAEASKTPVLFPLTLGRLKRGKLASYTDYLLGIVMTLRWVLELEKESEARLLLKEGPARNYVRRAGNQMSSRGDAE